MKHKTWFRLALKIVGIYLLARGVPALLNGGATAIAGSMGFTYWGAGSGGGFDFATMIAMAVQMGLVGSFLESAVGAYLVLGGGLLTNLMIPSNRPYCPDCGHELRSVSGVHCPECGARLPTDLLPPPSEERASEDDSASISATPLMRRLIPVGNREALIGYYVAVASIIPLLGIVLGPIAVTYGVEGLRHARRSPGDGGRAHGWIAVILGGSTTLLNACGWCVWPILFIDGY
jgi:hypothetical protein